MNTRRNRITRCLVPAFLGFGILAAMSAAQAADVDVSLGFSQPGLYGRVDIGRYPAPVLIVPRPVIVSNPTYRTNPVYLWVPPEHRLDWRRNCRKYGACGEPVYFVDDGWYRQNVLIRDDHRGRGHGRDDRGGHGHGHGRDHDQD